MKVVLAVVILAMAGPSDRMLDAGGVRLHIRCDGMREPGAPLVVLEAGAGNSAKTWDDVFTPISQFARVCAYDRQGLGSSERTSEPQGVDDVVETLHGLLGAAAEPPPYVLAGHSWGGPLVRLYATRYPVEVTGMVLIDSSHEDQVKRFAALDADSTPADPPRPGAEQIDLDGMDRVMTKAPWHANIPLVVLTHAPVNDEPGDPHGVIWQELQRELATRSPQGEQIVAQRAGHYIQNQEPGLVIDAVRRVVAKTTR